MSAGTGKNIRREVRPVTATGGRAETLVLMKRRKKWEVGRNGKRENEEVGSQEEKVERFEERGGEEVSNGRNGTGEIC